MHDTTPCQKQQIRKTERRTSRPLIKPAKPVEILQLLPSNQRDDELLIGSAEIRRSAADLSSNILCLVLSRFGARQVYCETSVLFIIPTLDYEVADIRHNLVLMDFSHLV